MQNQQKPSQETDIALSNDTLDEARLSSKDVMVRMMRSYIWPHKGILAISFLALIFVALTTSAIPLLIQRITDDIFVAQNNEALLYLPIAVAVIMGLKGLSEYIAANTEAFVAYRIVADIRLQIFEALTKADVRWLQGVHSGRLHSSFLHDVEAIRDSAARVLVALGKNLLKVIVLLGNMIYLNWQLSLSILVMLPIAMLFLSRQRKKMRRETKMTLEKTADTATLLSETLSAMPIIKAYGRESDELSRIAHSINAAFRHRVKSIRIRSASSPITETVVGFGLAIAIFVAGQQGMAGSLTAGEFTGFLAAVMLLYQPLRSLAVLQTALQEGVSASNRVFTVLDHTPSVATFETKPDITAPRGSIVFDNVHFGYDTDEDQQLFKGFNLEIEPGSRVALVGPSGAGKTTVFNLIMRFYDPDDGSICIDDENLQNHNLNSVRRCSALVTQAPILFDMTIAQNVLYGASDPESVDIDALLEMVAMDEFVSTLPHGVHTPVGEAGELLSGGQKQRLTLARALASQTPILLLDEPTSALDAETETLIQNTLDKLHGKQTVIIIAHRLATIRNADRIIVMDKGTIVEQGTHNDLISLGGKYAALNTAQID